MFWGFVVALVKHLTEYYPSGVFLFAKYLIYILVFGQLLNRQLWKFNGKSRLVEIGYMMVVAFFTLDLILLSVNAQNRDAPRY